MKKLLVPLVAVLAFSVLVLGMGCGGDDEDIRTVEGTIKSVIPATKTETRTFKSDLKRDVTLIILENDEYRYYLAIWGRNSDFEEGQRIEITFDNAKTLGIWRMADRVADEDGNQTVTPGNKRFAPIVSYKILAK